MPSAAIQFTQNAVVGGAGQAYVGVPSVAVTVANGNDTGVVNWTYTLLAVPTGSAFTTGVQQTGATPTFTFTPDVPGSFLFLLTVTDGVTSEMDSHSFLAADNRGYLYFSYLDNNVTLNYGTPPNTQGWEPGLNAILKDVHDNAFNGGTVVFADALTPGNNVFNSWSALSAYVNVNLASLPDPNPVLIFTDTNALSGTPTIPSGVNIGGSSNNIRDIRFAPCGGASGLVVGTGSTVIVVGEMTFADYDTVEIQTGSGSPLMWGSGGRNIKFTLRNSSLTTTGGNYTTLSGVSLEIQLQNATIGPASFSITNSGSFAVYVDADSMLQAGAVICDGTSTVSIYAHSPSNIDPSYVGAPGFTVEYTSQYTPATPSNWSSWTSIPTTVEGALDSVGAEIPTLINNDSTLSSTVTSLNTAVLSKLSATSVTGTGIWYSASGTLRSSAVTFTGDVSPGALSGNNLPLTVTALQGKAVSNTTPTTGYVLTWSGSSWGPAASAGGGSFLPLIFAPGQTAQTNVYVTEATLNTATGASSLDYFESAMSIYMLFTSYTLTVGLLGASGYTMIGDRLYGSALNTGGTLSFMPQEIRDMQITIGHGMSYSAFEPINTVLKLTGNTTITSDGYGAAFFSLSTGITYRLELHDTATYNSPTIFIPENATINVYLYGASTLASSAIVRSGGTNGLINIFVCSDAVTLGTSYATAAGTTVTYINSAFAEGYPTTETTAWNGLLGSVPATSGIAIDALAEAFYFLSSTEVSYSPAVSANWKVSPTTTKSALDDIASGGFYPTLGSWAKWTPNLTTPAIPSSAGVVNFGNSDFAGQYRFAWEDSFGMVEVFGYNGTGTGGFNGWPTAS